MKTITKVSYFRRWFINKVAYTRSSSRVRRYQRSFFSFSGCELISASVSQPIFFVLSITLVPPARHIRAHSKVDNGLVGRVHAKREWMKERKSALLVVFWELPVRPWEEQGNEEANTENQNCSRELQSKVCFHFFGVWWYFFLLYKNVRSFFCVSNAECWSRDMMSFMAWSMQVRLSCESHYIILIINDTAVIMRLKLVA